MSCREAPRSRAARHDSGPKSLCMRPTKSITVPVLLDVRLGATAPLLADPYPVPAPRQLHGGAYAGRQPPRAGPVHFRRGLHKPETWVGVAGACWGRWPPGCVIALRLTLQQVRQPDAVSTLMLTCVALPSRSRVHGAAAAVVCLDRIACAQHVSQHRRPGKPHRRLGLPRSALHLLLGYKLPRQRRIARPDAEGARPDSRCRRGVLRDRHKQDQHSEAGGGARLQRDLLWKG